MEPNIKIREHLFEIIKNQIESNEPPETKLTYNRLRKDGYDDFVTKQMIGQCLAIELFNVMKYKKPYDNIRYIMNLKKLPKEPFN